MGDQSCEPCDMRGDHWPSIGVTGWDLTPVCEFHLSHSWSAKRPPDWQPKPDRRITIDPTDEAVVERVAQALRDVLVKQPWKPGVSTEAARAVLSALADGVGS